MTFVGHDASRTGAPVAMLSLLRWARSQRPDPVEVLLCAGGPLVAELASVATTTVLHSPTLRTTSWAVRALRSTGPAPVGPMERLEAVALRRAARSPHERTTVVANTVAALRTAVAVAGPDTRLVCHVHELDHVVDRVLADHAERHRLLQRVDHFVAAGGAVATMLVERLGVSPQRVSTVAPFVEPTSVAPEEIARERDRLTGGADVPVVATIGPLAARKGPDRFVDLLAELDATLDEVRGVWIGAAPTQPMWREVDHDLARLDRPDLVRLQAPVAAPAATIAAADVVVSTAREDPFPLGLLEAAALGRPVLTFDHGGFSRMMIDHGLGDWVVPVGDTLALRDAVERALRDPDAARDRAAALQRVVLDAHACDVVAPELWDTIVGVRR